MKENIIYKIMNVQFKYHTTNISILFQIITYTCIIIIYTYLAGRQMVYLSKRVTQQVTPG